MAARERAGALSRVVFLDDDPVAIIANHRVSTSSRGGFHGPHHLCVAPRSAGGAALARPVHAGRCGLRTDVRARAGDAEGRRLIGAIDAYKTALTIDPTRVDALSNLGAAYVHLGQFDDAIAQYDAALKIDPSNATVRLNLALAYYKSARPNEAIQPLKIVVATDSRGEERVSDPGRLLSADGPVSRTPWRC